jgi:hypothetical protein
VSVRFELIGSWPWQRGVLPETVIDVTGGARPAPVRIAPGFLVGAGDARWLVSRTGVAARLDGAALRGLLLNAADAEAPITAPAGATDGVIVVGRRGADNVMAALGPGGERRWRRTTPRTGRGELAGELEVHADPAGGVYVCARDRGTVARVDVASGATTPVLEARRRDVAIQVGWGRAGWLEADGTARRWVTQPLGGGDARAVALPAELGAAIAPRPALLPDGGLLARDGRTLLWLRPDGSMAGFVAFGGAVPVGDRLAVGLRHRDRLEVTTWRGGAAAAAVALTPVGGGDELVGAGDEWLVAEGAALAARTSRFASGGTRLGDGPGDVLVRAVVDLTFPAVLPDASAVVIGTTPVGAYAVRIEVPYR